MQFLIELARVIQSMDEGEFADASISPSYLGRKHKKLAEKWLTHVNELHKKHRDRGPYWRKLVREIRYWEDQEIDYMYQRVMSLSRSILKNQYFEVQTHSGGVTIPDRTSVLNRLVELADKLLSDIYPSILRLVHYRIDTVEIHTPSVRGNINWNETILKALKTSAGIPTMLVCNSPERSFSAPENLLLYMAVTWVFNDAVHLYGSQKAGSISDEDRKSIWMVLKSSERILHSFLLTEIGKNSSVLKQITGPTPRIKPTLASIERRLKHSVNPQASYLQLIAWMRQYVDFNVNRYHDLANFTFQRTEDFDTMFELWVLLEMASHIGRMPAVRIRPLIEAGKPVGFRFKVKNRIFTLQYEKHYKAPMGKSEFNNLVNPDYTVEVNGQCRCGNTVRVDFDDDTIPLCECGNFAPKVELIMDAKNWRNKNRMEGVQKMVWYMVQMNWYRPNTGILFFSNYESDHDKENPMTNHWDSVPVNQENWEFINYVVKASRKPKYIKQLDFVLEQIASKLSALTI